MENGQTETVDMYDFEIGRFQELIESDKNYAYQRYGCTLLYSLPPEQQFQIKNEMGFTTKEPLDHYNAGTVACLNGDPKTGMKEFEKAMQAGCDRPELFFNMAMIFEENEDKKQAKEYFQKYIDAVEQWDIIPASVQEELDEAREHIAEM